MMFSLAASSRLLLMVMRPGEFQPAIAWESWPLRQMLQKSEFWTSTSVALTDDAALLPGRAADDDEAIELEVVRHLRRA